MDFDPTLYPYDTVVYITDTIGGQDWQGSGVLIAPDEVLTASHMLYTAGIGTALNVEVSPAHAAGYAPFGSAEGLWFHYFPIHNSTDTISGNDSQYDYAVIHLSRPFTGLGTMGLQSDFAGGPVNVTGFPGWGYGTMENLPQTVTLDRFYSLLEGTSLGPGSSGGPVWISGSNGPFVVGVVSTGSVERGYFTQITDTAFNQIESWIAEDHASGAPALAVQDTTTNTPIAPTTQPYTGPVSGLQNQYINLTTDSLNISAATPGWFIHSGSGDDAIAASSGTNVLDGGTGSNFLTGGSGTDTFFVDDRGPAADIWSTVANFHAGDSATIWGVTSDGFALSWTDNQGAAGYTGLTAHADASGRPTASLTLAGYSQADVTDGRLVVLFGTDAASGSSYMYIHDNG